MFKPGLLEMDNMDGLVDSDLDAEDDSDSDEAVVSLGMIMGKTLVMSHGKTNIKVQDHDDAEPDDNTTKRRKLGDKDDPEGRAKKSLTSGGSNSKRIKARSSADVDADDADAESDETGLQTDRTASLRRKKSATTLALAAQPRNKFVEVAEKERQKAKMLIVEGTRLVEAFGTESQHLGIGKKEAAMLITKLQNASCIKKLQIYVAGDENGSWSSALQEKLKTTEMFVHDCDAVKNMLLNDSLSAHAFRIVVESAKFALSFEISSTVPRRHSTHLINDFKPYESVMCLSLMSNPLSEDCGIVWLARHYQCTLAPDIDDIAQAVTDDEFLASEAVVDGPPAGGDGAFDGPLAGGDGFFADGPQTHVDQTSLAGTAESSDGGAAGIPNLTLITVGKTVDVVADAAANSILATDVPATKMPCAADASTAPGKTVDVVADAAANSVLATDVPANKMPCGADASTAPGETVDVVSDAAANSVLATDVPANKMPCGADASTALAVIKAGPRVRLDPAHKFTERVRSLQLDLLINVFKLANQDAAANVKMNAASKLATVVSTALCLPDLVDIDTKLPNELQTVMTLINCKAENKKQLDELKEAKKAAGDFSNRFYRHLAAWEAGHRCLNLLQR